MRAIFLPALFVVALPLGACCTFGPGAKEHDPEAQKREELARLQRDEARLARALEAVQAGRYAVATLAAAEIEDAAARALPMTIPAQKLNGHVTGTIKITSLENLSISRGKVRFDLVGKGRKIKVDSLGQMALGAQKVKAYVGAVQSGMRVRVEGRVDADRGDLLFKGRAKKVTLKKNKSLAGDIKNALNGTFFKSAHPIELGAWRVGGDKLAARAAMVAGDEVAVIFAP